MRFSSRSKLFGTFLLSFFMLFGALQAAVSPEDLGDLGAAVDGFLKEKTSIRFKLRSTEETRKLKNEYSLENYKKVFKELKDSYSELVKKVESDWDGVTDEDLSKVRQKKEEVEAIYDSVMKIELSEKESIKREIEGIFKEKEQKFNEFKKVSNKHKTTLNTIHNKVKNLSLKIETLNLKNFRKLKDSIIKDFDNLFLDLEKPLEGADELAKMTGPFDYKTFKEWAEACDTLPRYYEITDDPKEKFKPRILNKEEFGRLLNKFVETEEALERNWLAEKPKSVYNPIQKIVVPNDGKFAFFVDIHGDVRSVIEFLRDLQKQGILKKDSFEITDKSKFYIFFGGDYVDRAPYGVEVLYTVGRLKLANPNNVVLLKGNHDDINYKEADTPLSQEVTEKLGVPWAPEKNAYVSKLGDFFDLLTLALYVGSEKSENGFVSYLTLCHAGIDLSFDPNKLLSNPGKNLFCTSKDGSLVEGSKFFLMKEELYKEGEKPALDGANFYESKFRVYEENEDKFVYQDKHRYPFFGQRATNLFLAACSDNGAKYKMLGFIRGHHHGDIMPPKTAQNHGLFNSFGKQWEGQGGMKFEPGHVWTLNITPDSKNGREYVYGYLTYVFLSSSSSGDWMMEPHKVDVLSEEDLIEIAKWKINALIKGGADISDRSKKTGGRSLNDFQKAFNVDEKIWSEAIEQLKGGESGKETKKEGFQTKEKLEIWFKEVDPMSFFNEKSLDKFEVNTIEEERAKKEEYSLKNYEKILSEMEALLYEKIFPKVQAQEFEKITKNELDEFREKKEQLEGIYNALTKVKGVKFGYKTLAEWTKKCFAELPEFYGEGEFDQKMILSAEEVKGLLDDFMQANKPSFEKKENWVNNEKPKADVYILDDDEKPWKTANPGYLSLRSNHFNFVQKLNIASPLCEVCFIGDIHGGIHAILKNLWRLVELGYLDNNFKIIKEDFYIIFLGDYLDRGKYGLEVLCTALLLKTANWDKVFLLRGNHEEISVLNKYSFFNEVWTKMLEGVKKKGLSGDGMDTRREEVVEQILVLLRCLPSALFIGFGVGGRNDVVQCCHGGINPEFIPLDFITSGKIFGRIKKSGRALMWGDFNFKQQTKPGFVRMVSYEFGKNLTEKYLNDNKIRMIFRGHQHSNFVVKLIGENHDKSKTFEKLTYWGDVVSPSEKNAKEILLAKYHPIITLSTASAIYMEKEGMHVLSIYDGFGIWRKAENFEDWKLRVYETDLSPNPQDPLPEKKKQFIDQRKKKYVKIGRKGEFDSDVEDLFLAIKWLDSPAKEPVSKGLQGESKAEEQKPVVQETKEESKLETQVETKVEEMLNKKTEGKTFKELLISETIKPQVKTNLETEIKEIKKQIEQKYTSNIDRDAQRKALNAYLKKQGSNWVINESWEIAKPKVSEAKKGPVEENISVLEKAMDGLSKIFDSLKETLGNIVTAIAG